MRQLEGILKLDIQIFGVALLLLEKLCNIFKLNYMTVNHVDNFQFVVVQFHGSCGTTIFDDHDVEALIGKASYCGADALICKDACNDDIGDSEVAQYQAQIASGQRAVRGF